MELIAQARTPGHRSPERDSNRETRTATSDHIQHSTRRRIQYRCHTPSGRQRWKAKSSGKARSGRQWTFVCLRGLAGETLP